MITGNFSGCWNQQKCYARVTYQLIQLNNVIAIHLEFQHIQSWKVQ